MGALLLTDNPIGIGASGELGAVMKNPKYLTK